MVGRSASIGVIGVGWVHWRRWVVVWLVCCGGSSGFRGGGCECCLVGRVGVGLVDFFFLCCGGGGEGCGCVCGCDDYLL